MPLDPASIPTIGDGPIDAAIRKVCEDAGFVPQFYWTVHELISPTKEAAADRKVDGLEWDDWEHTRGLKPGKEYRRKLWSVQPKRCLGAVTFLGPGGAGDDKPAPAVTSLAGGDESAAAAKLVAMLESIVTRLDRLEAGAGGGGADRFDPTKFILTQMAETNKVLLQGMLSIRGGGGSGGVDQALTLFERVEELVNRRLEEVSPAGVGGEGPAWAAELARQLGPLAKVVAARVLEAKPAPFQPVQPPPAASSVVVDQPVRVEVDPTPSPDSPLHTALHPADLERINRFIADVAAVASLPNPPVRVFAMALRDTFDGEAKEFVEAMPEGQVASYLIDHAPGMAPARMLLEAIESELRALLAADTPEGADLTDDPDDKDSLGDADDN